MRGAYNDPFDRTPYGVRNVRKAEIISKKNKEQGRALMKALLEKKENDTLLDVQPGEWLEFSSPFYDHDIAINGQDAIYLEQPFFSHHPSGESIYARMKTLLKESPYSVHPQSNNPITLDSQLAHIPLIVSSIDVENFSVSVYPRGAGFSQSFYFKNLEEKNINHLQSLFDAGFLPHDETHTLPMSMLQPMTYHILQTHTVTDSLSDELFDAMTPAEKSNLAQYLWSHDLVSHQGLTIKELLDEIAVILDKQ